ncbi:MAG: hypothetical protein AABM31_07030 [Actinomycetota bacterium]
MSHPQTVLLVANRTADTDGLRQAVRERSAKGIMVGGEVGSADPMAAIQDTLARESFDEIVISTLPRRVSRWLHVDLPSKAKGLSLPVSHVEAETVPDEEPALAVR